MKNMKNVKNMKKMKMEDLEVLSLALKTCSLTFKFSLQRGCSIFNHTYPCFGDLPRIPGFRFYTNV